MWYYAVQGGSNVTMLYKAVLTLPQAADETLVVLVFELIFRNET